VKLAIRFIINVVYYFLFTLHPEDVLQLAETCTYIDVLINKQACMTENYLLISRRIGWAMCITLVNQASRNLVFVGLRELK